MLSGQALHPTFPSGNGPSGYSGGDERKNEDLGSRGSQVELGYPEWCS